MLEIHYEDTEILDLDPEFFVSWLSEVATRENKELGELNLIFCSDDYLLQMNREHLDHDYYTDIITFDYVDGNVLSGDLFISVDRVKDNAVSFNVEMKHELLRVIVHGFLHLAGYGDKSESEEKEMRLKENGYLEIVPRGTL
ncbi:MAG: rRNA maturation RNase YbeY [Crocinitomicaceae bacterium]